MGRLSLLQRFSVLCFVGLAVLAVVLGTVITSSLESNALTRARQLTAKHVEAEFMTEVDDLSRFARPLSGADLQQFTGEVDHIVGGIGVERIKIWNRDSQIVWSNDASTIGKRYPGNRELASALKGEVTSILKKPQKYGHEDAAEFLEVYVPIEKKGVLIVVEAYENLTQLRQDSAAQSRLVWVTTGLGCSLLYLLLFATVWDGSRKIDFQTMEISESAEKYRRLVESATDGIISSDTRGTITMFNRAAQRMFGWSAEGIVGQELTVLMPEQHREPHTAAFEKFIESGQGKIMGHTIDLEAARRDGTLFPIELSLFCFGQGDERVITGLVRDISERKAIQAQIIEMERNASVCMIAGSIGHELNNTLHGLQGYAELLSLNPEDPCTVATAAKIFSQQSLHLKVHANNLLNLSKPAEPQIRELDFVRLVEKITDFLTHSGILKGIDVVRDFADLPPFEGDPVLLEQLVRNLEINAAHAMARDGRLTLRIGVCDCESRLCFTVTDTGHGIPDWNLKKIFEPFFTTKEEGKGTGLGMYIIKQIVDQHHGMIRVTSRVGEGTTVLVELPLEATETRVA